MHSDPISEIFILRVVQDGCTHKPRLLNIRCSLYHVVEVSLGNEHAIAANWAHANFAMCFFGSTQRPDRRAGSTRQRIWNKCKRIYICLSLRVGLQCSKTCCVGVHWRFERADLENALELPPAINIAKQSSSWTIMLCCLMMKYGRKARLRFSES